MNTAIHDYYEELASDYDVDRFANSYGRYLDGQERKILDRYLGPLGNRKVLDLACGTGRLLHYCSTGADLSEQMIAVSRGKYPEKELLVADAFQADFPEEHFDAIICFHLLMHLQPNALEKFLQKTASIAKPGARLIIDLPSAERRRLLGQRALGWHGANAYTEAEVAASLGNSWLQIAEVGVCFFPIHRIPERWRSTLRWADDLLCRTFLKQYASYRVYILERR